MHYDPISKNIGGKSSLSRHSIMNRSSAWLCTSASLRMRTRTATTRAKKTSSSAWFLANRCSKHSSRTVWHRWTAWGSWRLQRSDTDRCHNKWGCVHSMANSKGRYGMHATRTRRPVLWHGYPIQTQIVTLTTTATATTTTTTTTTTTWLRGTAVEHQSLASELPCTVLDS